MLKKNCAFGEAHNFAKSVIAPENKTDRLLDTDVRRGGPEREGGPERRGGAPALLRIRPAALSLLISSDPSSLSMSCITYVSPSFLRNLHRTS